MKVRGKWYQLMAPEDDKGAGGGTGDGGAGDGAGADGAGGDAGAGDDKGAAGDAGKGAADGAGAQGAAGDSGKGAGDGKAADKDGYWPADWRANIAGTDEKLAARLSRYSSPKDVANALASMQAKISAGELRSTLPKNATEDQVKAWRIENGIPDSPDKYDLKLAGGLVVGAEDKPLIDNLLKSLHAVNANSGVASQVVNFYYEQKEAEEANRHQADKEAAAKASDAMHAEWGPEFRPNMNMVENLLSSAPAGVGDLIKFGRLSDGTPIMAHPEAIRWLNTLAREINPVTTLIPNAGANISGAIEDEIKKHEGNMGAPKGSKEYKAYWEDEKAQARYRDLLDARERAKKKAA